MRYNIFQRCNLLVFWILSTKTNSRSLNVYYNKELPFCQAWFIIEEWKTNLMSLAILFHFLCAQHVSDINISIIRSLRLCCWITKSVVLFSVRCVLEIWCYWFWVVLVLQTEAQLQPAKLVLQPAKRAPLKTSRTKSLTHNERRTRQPIW